MFCHLSPKGFIRLAEGFNPALGIGNPSFNRGQALFNSCSLTSDEALFVLRTAHKNSKSSFFQIIKKGKLCESITIFI